MLFYTSLTSCDHSRDWKLRLECLVVASTMSLVLEVELADAHLQSAERCIG